MNRCKRTGNGTPRIVMAMNADLLAGKRSDYRLNSRGHLVGQRAAIGFA